MNWEVLLHWMTHVREGSWGMFRGAVGKLVGTETDIYDVSRRLRIFLSDLGHADFFVGGSQRWHVRPPALAGLAPPAESAVLTGGRTPSLTARLAEAAASHGCHVMHEGDDNRPACVRIDGGSGGLAAAAADAGIPYVESFAAVVSGSIDPILHLLESAPAREGPANCSVRSFDIDSLKWVEGLHGRSACEFRSRYRPPRFYLHTRRGRLLSLSKREAVYAAAMLRGTTLAVYDAATSTLSVPASAPLPELYARAACLCAGRPAMFRHGRLCYRSVPPDLAAVLLVAAGQPYPELQISGSTVARTPGRMHGQPV
jgi:hypothetical protein